jgi:hypothetical protein
MKHFPQELTLNNLRTKYLSSSGRRERKGKGIRDWKKELGEVASQPNSTKVLGQKWFPKFSKLCTHYVHICADVEPTL